MAPQWKHPSLSPFLGDGLSDCALDDPLDSSSPEGRVKGESENREYESSCEESVGEKNNRDKRDTGESIEEEKGVTYPLLGPRKFLL
jgi:hypothetical protein